jgi:hypothetical protein
MEEFTQILILLDLIRVAPLQVDLVILILIYNKFLQEIKIWDQ